MSLKYIQMRTLVRGFIEAVARIALGAPARVVRKSTLERLERLAYRAVLDSAERTGDIEFLRAEIRRNQLTPGDLRRLSKHHTPLEQWPEVDDEIFAPGTLQTAEGTNEKRSEEHAAT